MKNVNRHAWADLHGYWNGRTGARIFRPNDAEIPSTAHRRTPETF